MGIISEAPFGAVTTRSCRRKQEGSSCELHAKVDHTSPVEDCTAESCLTTDREGGGGAKDRSIETAPILSSANDSCAGSSSSSWTWQSNSPVRVDDNVLEHGQSNASSPSSSSAATPRTDQRPGSESQSVENWHDLLHGADLSLTSGNGVETLPPLVSAGFPLQDQHQQKPRFPVWDSRPRCPSPQQQAADLGCFMQQDGTAFGSRSNVLRPPQFVDSFYHLRTEDNLSLNSQAMLLERYQHQHQHQHQHLGFNTPGTDVFYSAFNCQNGAVAAAAAINHNDHHHKSSLDLFLGSSTMDFKPPSQHHQQHITNPNLCNGSFSRQAAAPSVGLDLDSQFGGPSSRIHTADVVGQLQQQSIFLPGQGTSRKPGTKTVAEMSKRCQQLQETNRDAKRHRGSSTSQKTKPGSGSKRGGSHKREPALNTNLKPRAKQGCANDPQSVAARQRRERISDRLKLLQELIPNGSKVDLVTMLEKAINYVKFLQLQVKVLMNDEYWAKREDNDQTDDHDHSAPAAPIGLAA